MILHTKNSPLIHGGQLDKIAKRYDRPSEQWLDLSTGIAPFSYPIPHIPQSTWQQLPQVQDSLLNAAKRYYQAKHCLVTHGSQQVIELLPALWLNHKKLDVKTLTVYLPNIGYKEHQKAWSIAGINLVFYRDKLPSNLVEHAVVVVINPNNPTGKIYQRDELLMVQNEIDKKAGLMVIDEAFIDVLPREKSMVSCASANTIVLRSFGKFFGLAGIRIGFVCSLTYWYQQIKNHLGPWQVNGPALYIAEKALLDIKWQQQQREALNSQRHQLSQVLRKFGLVEQAGCSLFVTVKCQQAELLYDTLCQHGVYIRLTDEKNALRFGIPNNEQLLTLKDKLSHILPFSHKNY